MNFADYLPLFPSLGWLAALMFAAVWAGLPAGNERRHAGWLIGFCALRLLSAGGGVAFAANSDVRQLASVVSGMVLWEFARRTWNDRQRPHLPPGFHLLALECVILVVAVASAGASQPDWFLPIALLYAILPALLGGSAMILLWSSFPSVGESAARRHALPKLAVLGLGLYGLAEGAAGNLWGIFPPWIVAFALGAACLRIPALRSRTGFTFAAGLLGIALLGPLAVSLNTSRLEAAETDDLIARVERAARSLPPNFAKELSGVSLNPETRARVRQQLDDLRARDSLLHRAALWRFQDEGVQIGNVDTGRFDVTRAALPAELAGILHRRAFALPAEMAAGRPLAVALAPLSPGAFENPAAWLALEFPGVFWEVQRQQARRTGIALVGVLAAFCAMGFVLASRQRLESSQQLHVERLQAADKAKTEFLAFLSHELRTPLQTILGRAELLHAQPAAAPHAAAIATQGQLLLRLVTDLLDLGTIESGYFRLRPAPFTLRGLLAAVADTVRSPAAAGNIALEITVDPQVPDALVGDESRLRQILGNLLGNGVKYTARGGVHLDVAAARPVAGDRVAIRFRVSDTGPGLPPEKISQLFTLFTRLDDGHTFTREGTGVGLALVRRLCALMGGTVAAANRPEGGAEFTVQLEFPRAVIMTPPPAPAASINSAVAEGEAVLVVEDNSAAREFLAEALRSFGHAVETAHDGPTALAAMHAGAFDVVVLDVNLPGVDGVAVARAMRAQHPGVRIVGCSAEAFPSVREAALAAGMDKFLVKPVALAALAHAVAPTRHVLVGSDLFARLTSPEASARTRALLTQEWPQLLAEAEAAVMAGDADSPRRLSHYLKSSALLLTDGALVQLCHELSGAAERRDPQRVRTLLENIADHLARWPAPPSQKSPRDLAAG